jgi:hypothetical protein
MKEQVAQNRKFLRIGKDVQGTGLDMVMPTTNIADWIHNSEQTVGKRSSTGKEVRVARPSGNIEGNKCGEDIA